MTRARQHTGKTGEDMAVDYLRERGYKILERNFHCPFGEMDIIGRQGAVLTFVEVKTRRTESFGSPSESVGSVKQKKLSRIALFYLQKHRLEGCEARFDVLAIMLGAQGAQVELIRDAFDLLV